MRRGIVAVLGVLALPGSALARPADVNIVNTNPIPVAISGTPTVKLDGTANTVKLDPAANDVDVTGTVGISGTPTVKLDPTANTVKTTHAAYAKSVLVSPATDSARLCTVVEMPESITLLERVVVTTYFSTSTPIAYLRPVVKTTVSSGNIMNLRVPLTTSEADPVSNVRSGGLDLGLLAAPVFASAELGQVYSMHACLSKPVGEPGQAVFVITGRTL